MRTKTLLAAVLAAGVAASAVAQSNVYSLNVVGYYNVSMGAGQKVLLGNQLNTTNNTLAGVIPNPPPLSQFFKFNGFFISLVAATLTFVGEVRQGSLTNTLPKGIKVLRTSIVPQAGRVTTDLGL